MDARPVLVGLALAILAIDLGCSEFRSRRQNGDKAVATLGSELPSRDIYAKSVVKPPGSTASVEEAPEASVAEEITPSTEPPIVDRPTPTEPIVQLQAPVLIDPAKVGAMPTNAGVPNGTLLIAGSRRRNDPPTDSKPVIKETTRVVTEARAALDQMTSYQLSLKRQERVNDTLLPAEDLIMSIRRSPKSVRLTWTDGPHRGREVLYRSDEPGGLMHVNLADSKFPVPRLSIAPDSPMVMKNSRHPITEAGLDPLVASMEQADQTGGLTDMGMQTPPPLTSPHHGVLQKTPVGNVWRAYFDPVSHLPAIVECRAGNGDLLEYYLFKDIQPNLVELASSDAFDPNARWGPPRGLFGRASRDDSTTR